MKKLLAILLIAIVACSTASAAEEEEFGLDRLLDGFKNGWSTLLKTGILPEKSEDGEVVLKSFWKNLWGFIKCFGLGFVDGFTGSTQLAKNAGCYNNQPQGPPPANNAPDSVPPPPV